MLVLGLVAALVFGTLEQHQQAARVVKQLRPKGTPWVFVVIEPRSAMPKPNQAMVKLSIAERFSIGDVIGHTTAVNGVCVLHVTEKGLRMDPTLIDHEACHCGLDLEDLTATGYRKGMKDWQLVSSEQNAVRCAEYAAKERRAER